MTDAEIDRMIVTIKEMASRIGCDFIPDHDKLMAFRCAQREEEAVREQYRKAARSPDWHYDSRGYCDNPGRGY